MPPVTRPLGDFATVIRGVSFGKTEVSDTSADSDVAVLRAGNIGDELDTNHELVYVPRRLVKEEQMLRPGDIAICMSSGSQSVVGKTAQLAKPWHGSVGAFCAIVRPNIDVCVPEFLAYYLRSPDFRRWTKVADGANIKNLRKSELELQPIPAPPVAEQRRIADILARAEGIVRLRRQAAMLGSELIPSLFADMIGDPASNSRGWPMVELGAVISDGPQNGLYKPVSAYGNGTPILRIDAFYDGEVCDLASLRRLQVTEDERRKFGLREDDIVINRVNSPEYLGKSALIPPLSEEIVFESNMMRFSADCTRIEPRFLIQYLQTGFVKRTMLSKAKHAINQSSINQGDVQSIPLMLPPLAEQERFVRQCQTIQSIIGQARLALVKADELFQSLLYCAFRGEL